MYLYLLTPEELAAERQAADLAWRGIAQRPFTQFQRVEQVPIPASFNIPTGNDLKE